MNPSTPPLALLRGAATFLPPPLVARLAAATMRSVARRHPALVTHLAALPRAVVEVEPTDLPYRFRMTLGEPSPRLTLVGPGAAAPDASVSGSVATLLDLLEGRIDSDSLFFRRDLRIEGDTAAVVGLRNVLDRDELSVVEELGALCGPLRGPARAVGRALDRVLEAVGARVAAVHRTLHPSTSSARDVDAELARCEAEVRALTARLGALEARLRRREDAAP